MPLSVSISLGLAYIVRDLEGNGLVRSGVDGLDLGAGSAGNERYGCENVKLLHNAIFICFVCNHLYLATRGRVSRPGPKESRWLYQW